MKTPSVSRMPTVNLEPRFGIYGGQYVPETLMPVLVQLEEAYRDICKTQEFQSELKYFLSTYAGRPTPLSFAHRLTEFCNGCRIFIKREDLAHTGAHKINNTLGQALLAKKMGKKRVVAETGAGQHGVATATACALFGLECVVYMGAVDMVRQASNVFRMQLLGAQVIEVKSNTQTLKDAINDAIRDWVSNVDSTYYLLGSAIGPHPYPTIVRDFQSIIGSETRQQIFQLAGKLPDTIVACVGGGSNSIGIFHEFIDEKVDLIGVEAGGLGIETGKHASRFSAPADGRPGVLHGCYTYILQNIDGQIRSTHSISAGLDYPAVGPEHSNYRDIGRIKYTYITDEEAVNAFFKLCKLEGIIPALESAHAIAETIKLAPTLPKEHILIVNLSGRGDKDLETVLGISKVE